MALPIAPVVKPADLNGTTNGKLPASVLRSYVFPGYKQAAQAHHIALRCYMAFASACYAATGVRLTITSLADAYRTYDRQVSAFLARYEKCSYWQYLARSGSRRWNGSYWRLKTAGLAPLATPGTSNHGWALAFDVARLVAGRPASITGSATVWNWVRANAAIYGFSWELQSEPWHLRYVKGNIVPVAVTRYEQGQNGTQPPPPSGGLITAAPPATPFSLKVGVSDPFRVRWLQQILNERFGGAGFVTVDGIFGAQTDRAVRFMQGVLHITQDGVYGSQSATALAQWLSQH